MQRGVISCTLPELTMLQELAGQLPSLSWLSTRLSENSTHPNSTASTDESSTTVTVQLSREEAETLVDALSQPSSLRAKLASFLLETT